MYNNGTNIGTHSSLNYGTPYFQNDIECKITNKIHVNGQAMNKNMTSQSASGEQIYSSLFI